MCYQVFVVAVHDTHKFLIPSFKSAYSFGGSLAVGRLLDGSLAVLLLAWGCLEASLGRLQC